MVFGLMSKSSDGVPMGGAVTLDNIAPTALRGGNRQTDGAGNDSLAIATVVDTSIVLNLASAARIASGNVSGLSVAPFREIALDVNVTAVSGTSPTLQLFLDRLMADGATYSPLWQSSIITTAQQMPPVSIGPGCSVAHSIGLFVRLRWVIAGTSPSFTFIASIIGK